MLPPPWTNLFYIISIDFLIFICLFPTLFLVSSSRSALKHILLHLDCTFTTYLTTVRFLYEYIGIYTLLYHNMPHINQSGHFHFSCTNYQTQDHQKKYNTRMNIRCYTKPTRPPDQPTAQTIMNLVWCE